MGEKWRKIGTGETAWGNVAKYTLYCSKGCGATTIRDIWHGHIATCWRGWFLLKIEAAPYLILDYMMEEWDTPRWL